jgi:hypothetical protein
LLCGSQDVFVLPEGQANHLAAVPIAQRDEPLEPVYLPELGQGLLGAAIAITGNAKALLQLRAQIDRALKSEAEEGDAWNGKG